VVGAGADAFLLKPFPLHELTDKVRSLVDRPGAARHTRGPLGEDMQPTRPVMRAAHTMSTTSLRRRAQQHSLPPLPPDIEVPAPTRSLLPDVDPLAALVEPQVLTPSAVRLGETPPPRAKLPAPVVRMAGPVRVLTPARGAGEAAPSARPDPSPPQKHASDSPPEPAEEKPRHIELRPREMGLGFGRFTRVEMRARSFVVLTEAAPKPKFTVTTVITEKGVPLRKIETALPHPLAREEDADTVRRQLDLQHDEVLRRIDDLVLDGARRRVLWSDQSRSVDATLLAWVMSAVAQLAEAEVGTEETGRQLYLTFERALVAEDALRAFQITSGARVTADTSLGGQLPRRAVRAVAGWCYDFASSTLLVDGDQVAEPVRQATRRHADELERMGFYDRVRRRSKA
jgi:hypothetical protein